MNQQVLGNLDRIITALADDHPDKAAPMRADNTKHLIIAARRHEFSHSKTIQAPCGLDAAGTAATSEVVAR